ncbi:PTS lactose/cellobiose transporter subunit IIA [Geobacillus stearothermophilus]|uniref:Oligo-beta-mannoside-specific phosphotransferase enzyme IIA component n=1 Tax=Geobacillus thermoleovorans CCB_US3_UF5 TaxID=1111068 RepID=A0ABN3ZUM7_GEOTH|nr:MULTISPECIES: PTS lactose/cellobiose transporter subunit IIA [Geobacillus]AEV19477.1 Oligo-beta-mannoside-specific phosphotransferase enzyme IIA component [Geobacillus thermoleovorans CCB_US3_UF5]ATA60123.1 phosphoenolpyruvate-dependent sugar phosphotransferase system EIIA lactose specific [Geobacillus stearothermophilus]KFL16996.1 PTS dihydroxyacetone transporter [Geobacillus stearothermophilus]KFX35496.1 PTS dihydroxyacetone transporter [Geobacillus stearothermophilus]MDF9297484.1 PTS lac
MEKIDVNQLTNEQVAFQLILHSGNARSKIVQAIREYRTGQVGEAERLIQEAEQDLSVAHDVHFQLIQKEAGGEETNLTLLLMHAEDHVMSTLAMKEIVKEMLALLKERNL